jgi:hypothetical protein
LTKKQKKIQVKANRLMINYYNVINQIKQRVIDKESVSSKEKLVSICKPYTEILVKRKGKVEFGQKVQVVTDASGFVLLGNVYSFVNSDTTIYPYIIDEISKIYWIPNIVACDAGFGSKLNLELAKKKSIKKPFFHQKRGLHHLIELERLELDCPMRQPEFTMCTSEKTAS